MATAPVMLGLGDLAMWDLGGLGGMEGRERMWDLTFRSWGGWTRTTGRRSDGGEDRLVALLIGGRVLLRKFSGGSRANSNGLVLLFTFSSSSLLTFRVHL